MEIQALACVMLNWLIGLQPPPSDNWISNDNTDMLYLSRRYLLYNLYKVIYITFFENHHSVRKNVKHFIFYTKSQVFIQETKHLNYFK